MNAANSFTASKIPYAIHRKRNSRLTAAVGDSPMTSVGVLNGMNTIYCLLIMASLDVISQYLKESDFVISSESERSVPGEAINRIDAKCIKLDVNMEFGRMTF